MALNEKKKKTILIKHRAGFLMAGLETMAVRQSTFTLLEILLYKEKEQTKPWAWLLWQSWSKTKTEIYTIWNFLSPSCLTASSESHISWICHWCISQGKKHQDDTGKGKWRAEASLPFPAEVKLYNTMNKKISQQSDNKMDLTHTEQDPCVCVCVLCDTMKAG